VTVELPATEPVDAAERELARHAQADGCGCWGYFPSLTGRPGIHSNLPACEQFASFLPEITESGASYRFNFIRLSLRSQSQRPAYHLDSDAATALTGDPATLGRRRVGRILLNLSTTHERSLCYLDIDASAVALAREGSYVRAADQTVAARHAARATIPARAGAAVHGISFLASQVLHSGVDGPYGHFVAAYGYDCDARGCASGPAVRPTGR
jgi:hypothetical protein